MAFDIDSAIPLAAGQIPQNFQQGFMAPAQQQNAMLAMQLRMQQLRQVQQSENALRQLYSNPGNLDESGRPTANAMGQLMQVDPRTGLGLQQQYAQLDERKFRAGVEQSKVSEAHKLTAHEIGMGSLNAYEDTMRATNDPKLARQRMEETRAQMIGDAVADGRLPKDIAQRFPPADPVKYRAMGAAYDAAHTKPMSQYQRIEAGFKEKDEERKDRDETRAQAKERREQAQFARGDTGTPEDIEVTDKSGKKTITTGVWDKDAKQYVTTDGTKTPIEGNVRKVSTKETDDTEGNADTAELIAHYKLAPPSPYRMGSGKWPAIMKEVKSINPDFNAQQYQVAQRVRNSFASGAQDAKQMDAMNTVVHHLNIFDEVSTALKNHDVSAINRVINYVRTELGHPEVTSFDAAKGLIADEVVQSVTGSGAVFDREGMQKLLSSDRSGEQFAQQAQILRRLMAGRMGAKYQRWNSAKLPDDEFVAKLEPETIEGIRSYAPSNLKKALGSEGESKKDDAQQPPTSQTPKGRTTPSGIGIYQP